MRGPSVPMNKLFDAAKKYEVEGQSIVLKPVSERSGRIASRRC